MVAPADTIAAAPAIGGAAGACDPIDITTFTVETGERAALTFDGYALDASRGTIDHQLLMTESAWVAWTCPATGRYAFSLLTSSANWDSTLQVYTFGADNSPAALAVRKVSENDEGGPHLSYVAFDATGGTVYLVRISGYTPPAAGVNTILTWAQVDATVTNDRFITPDDITDLAGAVTGDTTSSRQPTPLELAWVAPAELSLWWRFTAPKSGKWTFTPDPDNRLAIARDADDPRAGQGATFDNAIVPTDVILAEGQAMRLGLTHWGFDPGAVGMSWVFVQPIAIDTFTIDADASGTPLIPVEAPTVDYVGDDDSDLVSYNDPDLDGFGRPVNDL